MKSSIQLFRFLAFCLLVALGAPSAMAGTCGFTTVSGGTLTATYDPFAGTTQTINNVQVTTTRINPSGSDRTDNLNFYLTSSVPNTNNIQLNIQSITTAPGNSDSFTAGQNVYFGPNQAKPTLLSSLSALTASGAVAPAGTVLFNYNGNSTTKDIFTMAFNVVLPPNLNLTAGLTIPFDINYSCVHGNGAAAAYETGSFAAALTLDIKVRSGLMASYVGTALDFGEVGNVTTSTVLGAPATYTRTGDIRVASSGPYTVSMVSNSNVYKMTFSGGDLSNSNQTLSYQANFLGSTRSPTTTPATPIEKTCVRAGLGSPPLSGGILLPVSVTLLEGGATKSTGNYQDTLNVTFTPLDANAPGSSCP